MPEPVSLPRRPSGSPGPTPVGPDRLESWKEIAAHFGREVRTVQGWEKNEGLPIHRHQHARQGSVYAFRSELDAWREARRVVAEAPAAAEQAPSQPRWVFPLVAVGLATIAAVGAGVLWKTQRPARSGEALSSVVVLPFLDLSPRHDQDYFSDGLTEEIIDALSRVPNLRVVARTSAFAFKGKANDVRQIGKQLDVSAVLEGSVRKDGDQLRITAQLNRVTDGTHLWSRTYDRQLRDIFKVQHEISQAIASELQAGDVPEHHGTSDLEAWQRYQEARYFFNQQQPAAYYKAIERYQMAIDRDPKLALAYAGMADSYAYLAENFAAPPKEVMPKAKAAAEKALALDPDAAESHISVGIVKLDYEWNREAAQQEFVKALQLNPGSGWAHHWYAHSLETQGRLDDAMKEMRAALALDPLSLVFYWDVGNELLMARRYSEAAAFLRKADELFPSFFILSWERGEAAYGLHDMAALHREIEKMRTSAPEAGQAPIYIAVMGKFAAYDGRAAEARHALDVLEKMRATQYVEPYMPIQLASALGDRERLRTWLKRFEEERSTLYLYFPLTSSYLGSQPEIAETQERVRNLKP
jgi:TolB-like protein/Tfp pilus assembly protein PilF